MENILDMIRHNSAIDVMSVGDQLDEGMWQLKSFQDGKVYVDLANKRFIGSIGRSLFNNRIFAAVDARFVDNPSYECLYQR
jgi:hypothetical protein